MCTIDFDNEGSTINVWVDRDVVSRRDHQCMVCSSVIPRGTVHRYHFARWTFDRIGRFKKTQQQGGSHVCAPCQEIRKRFGSDHGVNLDPSQVTDQLSECVGIANGWMPNGALLDSDDYKLWLETKEESREWRADLTAITRRYRKTPARRRFLEARWAQKRARAA